MLDSRVTVNVPPAAKVTSLPELAISTDSSLGAADDEQAQTK